MEKFVMLQKQSWGFFGTKRLNLHQVYTVLRTEVAMGHIVFILKGIKGRYYADCFKEVKGPFSHLPEKKSHYVGLNLKTPILGERQSIISIQFDPSSHTVKAAETNTSPVSGIKEFDKETGVILTKTQNSTYITLSSNETISIIGVTSENPIIGQRLNLYGLIYDSNEEKHKACHIKTSRVLFKEYLGENTFKVRTNNSIYIVLVQ